MRFLFVALTVALAALAAGALAGCGSSASPSATASRGAGGSRSATASRGAGTSPSATTSRGAGSARAFAWLDPAPPPPGWTVAHLSATAALTYPPVWRRIRSDPGTISAAREDPRTGQVLEFLNATPQQGEETLQNWSSFRPDHNREDGDTHVQLLNAARGLAFRNGHGSCVIDRYRTSSSGYQEIACLVRARTEATVIIAAAEEGRWAQAEAALERAVSSFLA